MKRIKNKYVIYAGKMSASGMGSSFEIGKADTIRDAVKIAFNEKRFIKDYHLSGRDYLEISIINTVNDEYARVFIFEK